MRRVFMADVSLSHLAEEMEALKGLDEIPPFPEIDPEE